MKKQKKEIEKIIQEGIELLEEIDPKIQSNNKFFLFGVADIIKEYHSWCSNIKEYFKESKIKPSLIKFFYEIERIPLINNDEDVKEGDVYVKNRSFSRFGNVQELETLLTMTRNETYKKIGELKKLDIIINKAHKKSNFISYDYNKDKGLFKVGKVEITFSGVRAKIINFFYINKDSGNGFKSYQDFNEYTKKDNGKIVNSIKFRQDIVAINKRVKKAPKGILKEIIIMRKKSRDKEINYYKWKTEK